MIGRITKYYGNIGVGVIAAEDGRTFRFLTRDVTNRSYSAAGTEVDFVIQSGRPRDIIPLAASPWTAFGAPSRV